MRRPAAESSMQLLACSRTSVDNCFARFSETVARRVWEEQRRQHENLFRETGTYWSIHTDSSSSVIEFLPLAVTFASGSTVYVSYNGGDFARDSSTESATLQLPFGYGLDEDTTTVVVVNALPLVVSPPEITVEPLSTHDWELLQLEAEWLENGGLLGQVSIIYPEQVLSVLLPTGAVAKIRVVAPFVDTAEPCFWLTAQTQVVVTNPPLADKTASTTFLRVIPSKEDIYCSAPMQGICNHVETNDDHHHHWIAVPTLKTVIVHPETCPQGVLARLCGPEATAVVRVLVSTRVPKDAIVIHPLVRQTMSISLFSPPLLELQVLNEATVEIARLKFVEAFRSELHLQNVVIEKRDVQDTPWRIPDFLEIEESTHSCREDDTLRTLVQGLPGNTPIAVGDVLRQDTKGGSEGEAIQICSGRQDSSNTGFILAEEFFEVANIISKMGNERVSLSSCEVGLYGSLLPPGHVAFPPILDMANDVVRRRRVAICGERGSGKTRSIFTIAAVARAKLGSGTFYVDCRHLRDSCRMQILLTEICQVLDEAAKCHSACCILDDLDLLVPSTDSSPGPLGSAQAQHPAEIDQANLIANVLGQRLNDPSMSNVFVVASCRSLDSLSTRLQKGCSLTHWRSVPVFNGEEREALFASYFREGLEATILKDKEASGFRPRDIEKLAQRVKSRLGKQRSPYETSQTIKDEFGTFTPLSRLGVISSIDQSHGHVEWANIGGLFAAKKELIRSVLRPHRYHQVYEKAKVKTPRGVLLYGFPGTGKQIVFWLSYRDLIAIIRNAGKTACVHALAREGGFSLIKCKGPEIIDKYIGASEAKVRQLFARAAAAAPSILFLDEIDSLAPRRGSDHTGVTDRIVNQLLTFLDGVEDQATNGGVFIMAATSRPDQVDPALLRPGRLERHVFFGYSASTEEQEDLFLKMAQEYELAPEVKSWIDSIDPTNVKKLCALSAADIKLLFQTARVLAVNDAIESKMTDKVHLDIKLVEKAFHRTKPSLTPRDRDVFERAYSKFNNHLPLRESTDAPIEQLVALR